MLLLFLAFVFYPREAYAYIDPFTGGYLFQMLYPMLAAILAILAFFPRLIKNTAITVIDSIRAALGIKHDKQ